MIFKGSKKIVGGLALAAGIALTGVAGIAQQGPAPQGQGGEQGGAERTRGHKGGKRHGRMGRRGHRGGGLFGGRFAQELNLTDAQKEQMRQIAERYRQTAKAQRGQRGQRGESRRGFDPLAGGAFDEAAVRAAAQARANARVEREVARARMMSEMFNVLTPEQKAQLSAARQLREQRRQEFRTRRGAGQGTPQLQ